jgi:predicted short-subunit dehydrogenase-like oxidoreductase (DUF2520 family)
MKISFIGAGRTGVSLGRYFKSRGLEISGYLDTVKDSENRAASITGSSSLKTYKELIKASDMIFVTVPDGLIESAWNELMESGVSNKLIAHVSGALSSKIFKEADKRNCKVISIHPMMTFPSGDTDIGKMEKMPLTIEGDLENFEWLLGELPNKKYRVSPDKKVNYHLAGVFASNLLIPVIHRALKNIEKAGLEMGEEIIFPIIEKTIENIKEKGCSKAATGPLERGDIDTISKHLKVQDGIEKELYIAASLELIEILKDRDKDYSEIIKMLKEKR